MAPRFAVTLIPVLGGRSPGVTVTVSLVVPPAVTVAGVAKPVATGGMPALLCGSGVLAEKSAALLFVSIAPPPARIAAVVFVSPGAAAPPSEQFALPYPTKSTADASGHDPLSALAPATRATLPEPAAIAMVPIASGAGRFWVPPAPAAS